MKVIKNYENMNIMEDNIIIIILNISNINNIHLHVYIPLIYKQFNYIINSNLYLSCQICWNHPKKRREKKRDLI
jgi:hypothetical protein